jgi:Salmonella virulence plasmid 65kDa B protein/FG-GAP-like repeat
VSATGAATYQIPIWAPLGPKGVQPNLALTYNSQSGDGTMGPGWSLSGLSAITRCNKTYAQDGMPAAVALATSDGYCLNGNRLRISSGTYGVAGSTYQTESADFSQITANGSAGNGPASFIVQGKDGLIFEYGNTTDSRIVATPNTSASQWLLNKVRDCIGNNYVVTYSTGQSGSTGIGIPQTISYTPNSLGSTSYNYTVSLTYSLADSASLEAGYLSGTLVKNTNRLDIIAIKSGANTIRKYALTYETSPTTSRSRLTQVKECTDDLLTDCLSPTTITYQNNQSGITPLITPAGSTTTDSGLNIQIVDLNGDGRQDIVGRGYDIATSVQKVWVQLATNGGFGSPIDVATFSSTYEPLLVDDFDGDGNDDILAGYGSVWTLYRWNGSGAFTSSTINVPIDTARYQWFDNITSVDFDGNGLPDLLSIHTDGKIYLRLNTRVC